MKRENKRKNKQTNINKMFNVMSCNMKKIKTLISTIKVLIISVAIGVQYLKLERNGHCSELANKEQIGDEEGETRCSMMEKDLSD